MNATVVVTRILRSSACVLGVVVVLLSACSSNSDGAIDTVAPSSTSAAMSPPEAATLRLSDFPPGWMAESGDIDDSSPCVPKLTPVAQARSEFFTKNISETEARNTVFGFATVDEVRDQFGKLREQGVEDCLRTELADQMAKGAVGEKDVTLTGLDFGPMPASASWGDETVAFRSKISVSYRGVAPSALANVPTSAYTDLVFVRVGRVVSVFVLSNTDSPFDEALRNALIVATAQRMKAK